MIKKKKNIKIYRLIFSSVMYTTVAHPLPIDSPIYISSFDKFLSERVDEIAGVAIKVRLIIVINISLKARLRCIKGLLVSINILS